MVVAQAADFNGDGLDDILAGDSQRTAFYIENRGNGAFEAPVAIAQAGSNPFLTSF